MNRFLSRSFLVVVVVNVMLAAAAFTWLDGFAGWLAPGREQAGAWLGEGIPLLQFIACAALLDGVMRAFAYRHPGASGGVPPLALQIATFVIYVVLLSAAMNLVFDKSLAAILGASGVIGLVLGFALRGLVSDVFSGIALQLDPSIRAGDWLEFQYRGRDLAGKLLDIAWRTVVFADRAENIVLIPNGEFASIMVTNRSRPTSLSEYGTTIDLGAELDEVRILAVLQGALNRAALEGAMAAKPAPYVRILSVKDGVTSYRMFYCLDNSLTPPIRVGHIVLGHALQFLKSAGIPVTRSRRTEISRPGGIAQYHLDRPDARLTMLASVRFLSVLPPADLATVAAEVVISRFPAGHTLLVAGVPGDSMFVVSEGSLDVVTDTQDGPVTLAQLWPGDCLGEMSLFTGEPRSAHVRTREPTVTFEVRKETMAGIFKRNPALVDRIAQTIDARLRSNASTLGRSAEVVAAAIEAPSILGNILRFFKLRPNGTAAQPAAIGR